MSHVVAFAPWFANLFLMSPKAVYPADRRTFLSEDTTVGLLGRSLDTVVPGSNNIVLKLYIWWGAMSHGPRHTTLVHEYGLTMQDMKNFKLHFDVSSDEDGNGFKFRTLMPELSTEDAKTAEKEALLKARLEEIAVSRPGWGRTTGRARQLARKIGQLTI